RAAVRVAERENTTLYAVALAAYKVLLHRLSGQRDLIVGTAFAGRDHPVTERLFGCFAKTVALRTDLTGAESYAEVVRRVRETVLGAQDHQLVPYEEIVARLDIPRDPGVEPVFQAQFTFQEAATERLPGAEFDGMGIAEYGSAKWDLTLVLTKMPEAGLSGLFEGSADLFDKATVRRFADMYARLLRSLIAEPDRPIDEHPLVSAEERQRILYGLNPYERPEHPYRTLAEPFEEQAARTPDAVALVGDEGTLTYA
ncbi:condensation domain-containing protein, partial [Actinomadura adrarensis]